MKIQRYLAALAALLTLASSLIATPLDDARAALKANDLASAEALLVPLTAVGATDAAAFHALGQLRERQNNLKDAVAAYEQATKLDATQAEYFSTLGSALSRRMGEVNFLQMAMMSGKLKKAFEKSVALDPKHVAGLIGLARFYANAPEIAGGSLEKAAEFAQRVRELNPALGESELGNVAERGEKFAEALAHFETAATLQPDSARAQFACGRVLAKLEKMTEARARYEAALKIRPDFAPAKKALAELDAPVETKG